MCLQGAHALRRTLVANRASLQPQYVTVNSRIGGRGVKRVHEDGKEWIVAPITSLRPQVLSGSKGALYYPPQEIIRSVSQWDGKPLVASHPHDPITNSPLSADDPGVNDRQGLGYIRDTRWERNALRHNAWFDVEKTRRVAPDIYNALVKGQSVECSTGLYTSNIPARPGANHNGVAYNYVARDYGSDHVAVLQNGERGACSVQDGCGVNVTNANPEGHNQYTNAAKRADAASEKARKSNKSEDHVSAAESHKKAMEIAGEDQNFDAEDRHASAYSQHMTDAESAKSGGPSYSGKKPGVTDQDTHVAVEREYAKVKTDSQSVSGPRLASGDDADSRGRDRYFNSSSLRKVFKDHNAAGAAFKQYHESQSTKNTKQLLANALATDKTGCAGDS